MASSTSLTVFVYTGNRASAGTDSSVSINLYSAGGASSGPIILNNLFSNNFEREQVDTFRLREVKNIDRFASIERIEVWKGRTLGIFSDEWYVDKIVVENNASNDIFVFPVFRWIKPGYHYLFTHLDTSLPQFDRFQEQRKMELEEKRKKYEYFQNLPKGPVQVKNPPPDEQFAFDYQWAVILKPTISLRLARGFSNFMDKRWNCIDDIKHDLFSSGTFRKPGGADRWETDIEFARQRIASINPCLISLMTDIPAKFPITDELLEPLLEGLSILQAIAQKRLFLCDLNILEGISPRPGFVMCKPIALLFLDKDVQLRPIAIQLFQDPGPDNPIFTPLDDPTLWKCVKMWYNNSDSGIHQALTHMGFTHLMMEGLSVATNRHLSPSHPVYKILAPHFLYIIAINYKGIGLILKEEGWMDKISNIGAKGQAQLIVKGYDIWRMDVNGLLPEDLKSRGLADPNVLPGYHFRDDAMMLFNAIKTYARSYVELYYNSPEMLKEDKETQAWAQELVRDKNIPGGGLGIKGVPGNGSLHSTEDLANIITCIIFTCSVAHASANFGQYDEYGFPPNYPLMMKGKPPSSKNLKLTEKNLVDCLPNGVLSREIMSVTTILSGRGTRSLGDFEVQYIFDPKAREVVVKFREELSEISKKIKIRNKKLDVPYTYLLPENIPNSITI